MLIFALGALGVLVLLVLLGAAQASAHADAQLESLRQEPRVIERRAGGWVLADVAESAADPTKSSAWEPTHRFKRYQRTPVA